MVIEELKHTIENQENQINKLTQRNNKINVLNKDLKKENRFLYNALKGIATNKINIKELQTIYYKIGNVLKVCKDNQEATNQIKEIKNNADDNLFNIAMSLYEYKPY